MTDFWAGGRRRSTLVRGMSRTGIAGLVAVAAAALMVACSSDDDPCAYMTTGTAPVDTSQFAIGMDQTADEMPLSLPDRLMDDVSSVAADHTVSVGVIQGDAQPDRFWLPNGRGLQPKTRSQDSDNADNQGEDLVSCLRQRLPAARSTTPGTDVLAAIRSLADSLGPADHRGQAQIALVTNGLSNTGELDLRPAVATDQSSNQVVDSAAAGAGFPDLRNVSVTFYHLGLVARGRQQLSPARKRWVEEIWKGICQRSHATRCDVRTETGDPTQAVPAPTDPQFSDDATGDPTPTPTPTSPCRPVLPAEELFQPGEARLAPNGDQRLKPIKDRLIATGGSAVIEGHTATWGSVKYRLDLSKRRAEVVKARLVALGADGQHLTTRGMGSSRPRVHDTNPDGSLNERLAPLNRRIEIIFGGSCA